MVFAGLFLGRRIPSPREIWEESQPNLAFGYSLALGQYVMGLTIAWCVLTPLLDTNPLLGVLVPIAFQGGHGTVAGLDQALSALGSQAKEVGLGLATLGILSAAVFGSIVSSLHQELLRGGDAVATLMGAEEPHLVSTTVPLFPIAMIAGLGLQVLMSRFNKQKLIARDDVARICDNALALLVVCAMGALALDVLVANWVILLVLGLAGVGSSILMYSVLARQAFDADWAQRGLGELGQSMGTTAIGLLLFKQFGKPGWVKQFSYKQPFYEPLVGGGLVTGLAVPLFTALGIVPALLVVSAPWLLCTVWAFRLRRTRGPDDEA